MDPSLLIPGNLVDPLAKLTAVGAAITGITEVLKLYVPEDHCPPPLIAGIIAALFTALWVLSSYTTVNAGDALAIGLIWYAMFAMSIAVYHTAALSVGKRAVKKPRASKPPTIVLPPGVVEPVE
jgi:ABC-type Mn2+/Zn2+ transport system permease subunit